jgi:hypothetical protein
LNLESPEFDILAATVLCSETGAFDAEAVPSLPLAICKFQGQSGVDKSMDLDQLTSIFCVF